MLDFLIIYRSFNYTLDELIEKCGIPNKKYAYSTFRTLFEEEFILVSNPGTERVYRYTLNKHKADGLIKYVEQYIETNKMMFECT